MKIQERCPICGASGKVTSVGAFGWVATCSDCFDGDPEAPEWRHIRGLGESQEQATDKWLEDARETAAVEEIPTLTSSYRPNTLFRDIERQVALESERQRRWCKICNWYGPINEGLECV